MSLSPFKGVIARMTAYCDILFDSTCGSITASASTYATTTWTTAATDVIHLGFQGFLQEIDYVQEKIKAVFDNRDKIKYHRKSLFTTKITQSSKIIKKQTYTMMIPPKINLRGKQAQRK